MVPKKDDDNDDDDVGGGGVDDDDDMSLPRIPSDADTVDVKYEVDSFANT